MTQGNQKYNNANSFLGFRPTNFGSLYVLVSYFSKWHPALLPLLAACGCPLVISNLCQRGFQASHWASRTDQSVCNSPSTFSKPTSPLVLHSEWRIMLITILVKSTPSDLELFSKHSSSTSKVGVQGKCHVIGWGVALCLNNTTGECVLSIEKVLNAHCQGVNMILFS